MNHTHLLHHLLENAASGSPDAAALSYRGESLAYGELAEACRRFAGATAGSGMRRGDRVAIYMEKRFEAVIACFGAVWAGCTFVPINPLLKPEQVAYILRDCSVRLLLTTRERFAGLAPVLAACPELHQVVVTPGLDDEHASAGPQRRYGWDAFNDLAGAPLHRVIDSDVAAILYTSGSTGKPKGVVLSHRNMVTGAKSVASYLENRADDVILAALPLSFDAGFSQLTTAFHTGARVVLLNYLFPKDVLNAIGQHGVTGLTAVPPLWIQLSQTPWAEGSYRTLRYLANTGGRMPKNTLDVLRSRAPQAKVFLMYGLTEAFRATYLDPSQLDLRPDSIGKAIPNSEILVLRKDGTPCEPDEPGELVQRGPLVSLGYWNAPDKTAERFRPLPALAAGRPAELPLQEMAVFSGDTVRMDAQGYLYFIGRDDDMIKTSGYRVSPTEIEEIVLSTNLVLECAAFGTPDPELGEAIVVVAHAGEGEAIDEGRLTAACRRLAPPYMVPARFILEPGRLPRNPNGKLDRTLLSQLARATAT